MAWAVHMGLSVSQSRSDLPSSRDFLHLTSWSLSASGEILQGSSKTSPFHLESFVLSAVAVRPANILTDSFVAILIT